MKYILTILNVFTFYLFGHGQNKTIHISNYLGSRIEIKSSGEKPKNNQNTIFYCIDKKTRDTICNYILFVNGIKISKEYGHSERRILCKGNISISIAADGYKTASIENKYFEPGELSYINVSLARIEKK